MKRLELPIWILEKYAIVTKKKKERRRKKID
jgi:hypothetical protein